MSTTETEIESTGVKAADEFIAEARKLGLVVEVKSRHEDATYFKDGSVMLPATTVTCAIITLRVPEQLNDTALGLCERANTLYMYWSKRDTPRARGRWVCGNHSYLGGSKDMHVMKRAWARLQGMADDANRLRKMFPEG